MPANAPAGQGGHTVAPADGAKLPVPHGRHALACAAPATPLKVPTGHGVIWLPPVHHPPGAHSTHVAERQLVWFASGVVPVGQAAQALTQPPGAAQYVLPAHAVQVCTYGVVW